MAKKHFLNRQTNVHLETIQKAVRYASQSLSAGLSGEKLLALSGNRKVEIEALEDFVRNCHELGRTEFFFVSGTPGAGKTFSINQIMLKMRQENIALPVYINCFELDSPATVHEVILEAIFQAYRRCFRSFIEKEMLSDPQSISYFTFIRKNSLSLLEKCCLTGWEGIRPKWDSRIILLVLDEIDSLVRSGNQPFSIIFSILDLLRYSESRVSVIGVSNQVGTTAFEENKLLSRIKGQLIFKAYTEAELFQLIVRRMKVFGGEIQIKCSTGEVNPKEHINFDIFEYHAMCIISRKCGGMQGDARQVIHGFKHVLMRFLEQSYDSWNSLRDKIENSSAFTKNIYVKEEGLINTQFAFDCMESFGPCYTEPQLRNLPFLAYIILAICCRIQIYRSKPHESLQDMSQTCISVDSIAGSIHALSARTRKINLQKEMVIGNDPPYSNMITNDVASRIENYAGIQAALLLLAQLHIVHFTDFGSESHSRGAIQLSLDLKVLKRALRDTKYCPYPFVGLI